MGFNYGEDWDGMPIRVDSCPEPAPSERYAAAIYWALVTITSVGYGDITPNNPTEAWWCTTLLLIGSCLWAYIIGNVCGIVSTLDVETSQHQQIMDQLNSFMADRLVPPALQHELRLFFNMRKDINKAESYQELLEVLSPDLKAKVTLLNSSWLYDVPVVGECSERFVVAVSDLFASGVFIPHETIPWNNCLCSVSRGVATWNGRVHTAGMHWGDDFILHEFKLKYMEAAHALTYIEMLTLTGDRFYELLKTFPLDAKQVRKFLVRMTIKRGVLYYAKKLGATTRSEKVNQSWSRRWKRDIERREEQVRTEISSKASVQSAMFMPKASSKSRKHEHAPKGGGLEMRRTSQVMEKQLNALQLIMGKARVSRGSGSYMATPTISKRERLQNVAKGFKTKALKQALQKKDMQEVHALVKEGADINHEEEGAHPLFEAARHGNVAGLMMLLQHGADADQKDVEGRTPLQISIEDGHEAAVVVCLGAPHRAPRDYIMLAELARQHGHSTIADIIASYAPIETAVGFSGAGGVRTARWRWP